MSKISRAQQTKNSFLILLLDNASAIYFDDVCMNDMGFIYMYNVYRKDGRRGECQMDEKHEQIG